MGLLAVSGGTPSPRHIRIIELARNHEIIYGAQSLAGKILMSKNLRSWNSRTDVPKWGRMRSLRTVTASTIMTDSHGRGKVGCHIWLCKTGSAIRCRDAAFSVCVEYFFRPYGACICSHRTTCPHGLRRGLHSFAAPRLEVGTFCSTRFLQNRVLTHTLRACLLPHFDPSAVSYGLTHLVIQPQRFNLS